MRTLTREDLASWNELGFIVVRQAISQPDLDEALSAIWTFLGMDPACPDDWYSESIRAQGMIDRRGMISCYHLQPLWNNRQNPRVHSAFADLWGTERLWVSMDRVNMNPPATPQWSYDGFIHLDVDTSRRPVPLHIQGVLSLTGSPPGGGGFRCVPGFQRKIDHWIETRPPEAHPRFPDTTGMEIVEVPMSSGDLLIFNGALPHGNSRNTSTSPRLAQYITMWPEEYADEKKRQERIMTFLERRNPLSPAGARLPADPRGWEARSRAPVQLTPLGRRLLGMDAWQ